MPDAHVERALELVDRHAARRRRPGRRPAPASRSTGRRWPTRSAGSTRARLAASPPPVTWLNGVHLDARRSAPGSRARRSGSAQQLLAERAAELRRPRRSSGQPARSSAARGGPASSRWSAGRWTPSRPARRRRGPGPAPSSRSASTTPVPAPATSYSSGPEQAGVLGGLAADQRAAGQHAALGDALDDGGDPLGHDLAAGDVVGHEQRLGAADHEVVDDHADQVVADGVVPVERLRDRDLGADAVGGGREQRTPVAP